MVDEKCCIIQLTDEIAMNTCIGLFTDRATYILLAVDSEFESPEKVIVVIIVPYFPLLERDSSPKYIPLLDEIEPDLAARLDILSNPKGGDQKLLKSWSKTSRTSKQSGSTPVPGQARRRQSAIPSGIALKRKFKPNLEKPS